MGNGRKNRNNDENSSHKSSVKIDAAFRVRVEQELHIFSQSNDVVYTFPALLTNVERAFVHNYCAKFNLKSKSNGFGKCRLIHFITF